jgi:ribulose-bisphosphate carboxylase small chain
MRITQGTFSYLPDLTDEEIALQLGYALGNGWAVSVEFTAETTPRDNYWAMWGLPMFGLADPAGALHEVNECRRAYPDCYIKVSAYDSRHGRQTTALSFLVNRPQRESTANGAG